MKFLVIDETTDTTSHHTSVESATRWAGFLLSLGHTVRMEVDESANIAIDKGPTPREG